MLAKLQTALPTLLKLVNGPNIALLGCISLKAAEIMVLSIQLDGNSVWRGHCLRVSLWGRTRCGHREEHDRYLDFRPPTDTRFPFGASFPRTAGAAELSVTVDSIEQFETRLEDRESRFKCLVEVVVEGDVIVELECARSALRDILLP